MTGFFPFVDDVDRELPPLRIHHFLVWTAVAAVLLSIEKLLLHEEAVFSVQQQHVGMSALDMVWHSLAICCLGYGIYWYRSDKEFLDHPGHGLIVISGITYLLATLLSCAYVVYSLVVSQPMEGPPSSVFLIIAAASGFLFLGLLIYLNIRFARRFADYPRWRTFYIVSAILVVVQAVLPMLLVLVMPFAARPGLSQFVFSLLALPSILLGLYLVWTVVKDMREGYQFHWSHYAGVIVELGPTLMALVQTVWSWMQLAMGVSPAGVG